MRVLLASIAFCVAGCSEGAADTPREEQGSLETQAAAAGQSPPIKPAGEGPFGLELGAGFEGVKSFTEAAPGVYATNSPPRPHPDFEQVAVEAYPDAGICEIRGIGPTIPNDGNGLAIRAKVDALAAALETKYGPAEKIDRCGAGEIGCAGEFWMMTLSQGQRAYGYSWSKQNEFMRKHNIGDIYLVADAEDIMSTYVRLLYGPAKKDACAAARKKASATGL